MTTPTEHNQPRSAIGPILGPVLAQHRDGSARLAALAVACRGLDDDVAIPPAAIRLWLRTVDKKRFGSITASPQSFRPVLSRARAHVASASDPLARREKKVRAARALVGSLLTPLPDSGVSAHKQATARHGFTIVGGWCLDSIDAQGWENALVTGPRLGAAMGCADSTALAAVRTCIDLRWLHLTAKRRGGGMRVRMPHRLDRARGATAEAHAFAVDAPIEDDVSLDPVAEIIALAGHPSVAYHLGPKAWLVALADEVRLDPVLLGVAKSPRPALRRAWAAALVEHAGDPEVDEPLTVLLDRHAAASGALARAEAAEIKRTIVAERRRVETEEHRQNVTALHRDLLPTLDRDQPIPAPGDTAASARWVETVIATLGESKPDASVRGALARALTKRLAQAGYPEVVAARVGRHIVGLPPIETDQKEAAA